MSTFFTIREAAKRPDCPFGEYRIRLLVAQGRCPGVYTGKKFLVNYPLLLKKAQEWAAEGLRLD